MALKEDEEKGLLGRIYGDRARISLTESKCERWYESEVKSLRSALSNVNYCCK